jgi:hypothetical protein
MLEESGGTSSIVSVDDAHGATAPQAGRAAPVEAETSNAGGGSGQHDEQCSACEKRRCDGALSGSSSLAALLEHPPSLADAEASIAVACPACLKRPLDSTSHSSRSRGLMRYGVAVTKRFLKFTFNPNLCVALYTKFM